MEVGEGNKLRKEMVFELFLDKRNILPDKSATISAAEEYGQPRITTKTGVTQYFHRTEVSSVWNI